MDNTQNDQFAYMNNPTHQNILDLAAQATPTPIAPVATAVQSKPTPRNLGNSQSVDFVDPAQPVEVTNIESRMDPLLVQQLARVPSNPSRKLGAFIEDGTPFIYADCLEASLAGSHDTKQLAYAHRISINMENYGFEPAYGPIVVTKDSVPPSLFGDQQVYAVYRVVFKLTPRI